MSYNPHYQRQMTEIALNNLRLQLHSYVTTYGEYTEALSKASEELLDLYRANGAETSLSVDILVPEFPSVKPDPDDDIQGVLVGDRNHAYKRATERAVIKAPMINRGLSNKITCFKAQIALYSKHKEILEEMSPARQLERLNALGALQVPDTRAFSRSSELCLPTTEERKSLLSLAIEGDNFELFSKAIEKGYSYDVTCLGDNNPFNLILEKQPLDLEFLKPLERKLTRAQVSQIFATIKENFKENSGVLKWLIETQSVKMSKDNLTVIENSDDSTFRPLLLSHCSHAYTFQELMELSSRVLEQSNVSDVLRGFFTKEPIDPMPKQQTQYDRVMLSYIKVLVQTAIKDKKLDEVVDFGIKLARSNDTFNLSKKAKAVSLKNIKNEVLSALDINHNYRNQSSLQEKCDAFLKIHRIKKTFGCIPIPATLWWTPSTRAYHKILSGKNVDADIKALQETESKGYSPYC